MVPARPSSCGIKPSASWSTLEALRKRKHSTSTLYNLKHNLLDYVWYSYVNSALVYTDIFLVINCSASASFTHVIHLLFCSSKAYWMFMQSLQLHFLSGLFLYRLTFVCCLFTCRCYFLSQFHGAFP